MKHCLYCAQTSTELDEFGYCKKYDCLGRSGKRGVLENLMREAGDLYSVSNSHKQLGIRSYVTNSYNPRTRKANEIARKAQTEFGFVPMQLLERIPIENRDKWDKNIRW